MPGSGRPAMPSPTRPIWPREFGCARATVNRALRELAATGAIDRRRKGGTRVALNPVRQAILSVPLIRAEVEARGAVWSYRLARRGLSPAPAGIARAMGLDPETPLDHVEALHLADDRPYVAEARWIDPALPGLDRAPFDRISANEWLLQNVPWTRADLEFGAFGCDPAAAGLLGIAAAAPVLVIRRTTWDGGRAVTHVRLTHAPGHLIRAEL